MGSGGISISAAAYLAESLFFSGVPDDILVNILCRLDEDPRDLARLACVSTRFCKLIKTVCWKFRCEKTLPLLVAELLQAPSPASNPCSEPPGGWASLQKLLVCCPGLWHAGVLLESWDFGLDREIGWFDDFGYTDGPSSSDRLIVPGSESTGYSYTCESLAKNKFNRIPKLVAFTSPPFVVECSPNGPAACTVYPDGNDIVAHVSSSICALAHHRDGNEGSMICGNEKDMAGGNGKEAAIYKCECDKKWADHDGVDSDGIIVGINCHIDEEGLNFVKTEVGMDKCQCNKTGNKLGPKHCNWLERSVGEVMNSVAKGFHVRDHEFQESVIEKDSFMVAMKGGAAQICKSTCSQLRPTSLNSDPLYLMSSEAVCRHQSKEESYLVDTHVKQMHIANSCATSHEKRMQEHELKPHKRQRKGHYEHCHVTTKPWNLSREQGNKLLANRFRADSLYICDWPGCSHPGDKRMYKLFRGVFKNFKHSHVWRNLKDMQAKATNVGCAFCVCKSTWDMATTFCLKRSIDYHDDGEPVVRAYVCENGHVAGAWTDRPMYTL